MASSLSQTIVVPGQAIASGQGNLQGRGTYLREDAAEDGPQLVASVAGTIERVNKLLTVRPAQSRYLGEVGDLIVGRVTEVGSKRWKVDVNGQKDAILMLSSVNLPGGVQRIRTYEDQLQMRTFFQETDLISAEVQNVGSEGSVSLHTRSLKYGKLENGQLLQVPSGLIKRMAQHYVSFPFGVDIILGANGYIWITRSTPKEWTEDTNDVDEAVPLAETLQRIRQRHAETPILGDERLKIARVANAVNVLRSTHSVISAESIQRIYSRSIELGMAPKDMLQSSSILRLIES